MIAYEQHLDADPAWALREGSMHFESGGSVHTALEKIARRLDELKIPYAVVGGMALFSHGYRRFTEDVDILLSGDGLAEVHRRLDGLGYVPVFSGSRNLRDTESGVRIEFLVSGDYPGDGKPKPVAFPAPQDVSVEREGIHYLGLPSLIELKLASGMSPGRRRDLGDVQELIRTLDLPENFSEQLNPFVHEVYRELWAELQ
ncbi:MAG: hypothetical protein IIA67_03485 [Planctomycetes bacterium]|nr:hypothetical protein [Planctomycetota bacterium]